MISSGFLLMTRQAGVFPERFGFLKRLARHIRETEIGPAAGKTLAVFYRSFQRDVFVGKRALQTWFVFGGGLRDFQNHHGPFRKLAGVGEFAIGRRVDVNVFNVFPAVGTGGHGIGYVVESGRTADEHLFPITFGPQLPASFIA
jgi:hypothetical protein